MAKKWQNQIEKLASFRSKSFLEERKLKKILKISFKIRQKWSKTYKILSRILKMGQNASVYKNVPFVGNQLNLTYMKNCYDTEWNHRHFGFIIVHLWREIKANWSRANFSCFDNFWEWNFRSCFVFLFCSLCIIMHWKCKSSHIYIDSSLVKMH